MTRNTNVVTSRSQSSFGRFTFFYFVFVRKDMDVKEQVRLSNIGLRHKLK